jgi:hypothetical protein
MQDAAAKVIQPYPESVTGSLSHSARHAILGYKVLTADPFDPDIKPAQSTQHVAVNWSKKLYISEEQPDQENPTSV